LLFFWGEVLGAEAWTDQNAKIHGRAAARPPTPEPKLKREEEKEGGKR